MKKLLLTGFDPFAHYNINPSWEAVKALPEVIGSFSVHKMLLPNIYGTAGRLLLEEAERLKPDVILMTGMDSGSTRLHLDAVAVNLRDALLEDNKGAAPWGEPVVPGAPAAYFATIPTHALVKRLQKQGHFNGTPVKTGFAHVPLLPQMVWDESKALPLEETVKTLRQIIENLSEILTEEEHA